MILPCKLLKKLGKKNLEDVFNTINEYSFYSPSFAEGLAGIGWCIEYIVSHEWVEVDTNLLLEDVDSILAQFLDIEIQKQNCDFLYGALGIVLYFIIRSKKNSVLLQLLQNFVKQLAAIGEKQSNVFTKWKFIVDNQQYKKLYSISLSHGMASIAVILSKLYNIKGLNKKSITTLLQGCVNYILAQEIDYNKYGSFFPNYALESMEQINRSRLAWCYGDLGIASALWQAGVALQNDIWKNKALEILLFAAKKRKNLNDNYVKDACLCHGTAGIGHIFYRTWWNTRMPEFKKAADYWFDHTLKMAKFGDGLAGYKQWCGPENWVNKYGILEGIAGIGLALHTYSNEIEPTWDECLLLS